MGQESVPASVTRKKINLPAVQSSPDDCVGRLAERRLDAMLDRILQSLDLVEPASANDPDSRRVFCHRARFNGNLAISASLQPLPASPGWRASRLCVTIRSPECRNFSSRPTVAR